MAFQRLGLLCVGLLLVLITSKIRAEVVTCYVGTWAEYRTGDGSFKFEDIDPFKCTHLIYAFADINDDGTIKILDNTLAIDSRGYERFNALKQRNGELKTLIAIGGASASSEKYSNVFSDQSKRDNFKRSAIDFLKTYNFNGLDLDWEYPGQNGGAPSDKDNFSKLIEELWPEFNNNGFILTAAVPSIPSEVDKSYDVSALSRNLHFIHVMTYDLHGTWDQKTGENAPLYSPDGKNVDDSIRGWLDRGADPSKLVLGLAVYGRSFTLSDQNQNGIGAPITGAGNPGPISQEAGLLGYTEICKKLNEEQWTRVWSGEQHVPYAFKGDQWVGYDDKISLIEKVNFAKEKHLAGAMVWSLESDDPRGVCTGEKYPLLSAINQAFGRGKRRGKHAKHAHKHTKKQHKKKRSSTV